MPYITKDRRRAMLDGEHPDNAGELNYNLSREIGLYVLHHGISYARINDVLGALDGASKEFYRRVATPYEDNKVHFNGDLTVYSMLAGEIATHGR